MVGHGWSALEIVRNVCAWLEMVEDGWAWLDIYRDGEACLVVKNVVSTIDAF